MTHQRVRLPQRVLGGSWVVLSRVITRVTILITLIRGLITPLLTTPEPPSRQTWAELRSSPLRNPQSCLKFLRPRSPKVTQKLISLTKLNPDCLSREWVDPYGSPSIIPNNSNHTSFPHFLPLKAPHLTHILEVRVPRLPQRREVWAPFGPKRNF